MRGEEFFSVGKKSKIAVWCFVLTFFILPFVMAAADFSLFTLHSSLAEDSIKVQPNLMVEEEEIPDSLLHPRWKIQKTTPVVTKDLDSTALDLRMPDNIKQEAEYDDSAGVYLIGSKIGSSYLNTPILMMPDEYQEWSRKREFKNFFRQKNAANFATQGKDKFDFADMHFDLGPAEKIFGPGGVRIKTQGTAELKLGANFKSIDNPSLPERNRNTKAIDFDEKINLNVTGKVGDKVNMNLNYNTDATFDFDSKNIKLRYEGKEDEIIKLVEAGNITFPSNNSLVKGAASLFGVRTDMQFGKLKLQTAFSQKKSTTTSVSSKGGVQLTPYEINVADYEENRHFFLANYFRERYDAAMQQLPNLMTGIQINRVEVWVTNKTGTTANTRDIVGFTDLGESLSERWGSKGDASAVPSNDANSEYNTMATTYAAARIIDQTTSVLDGISDFHGGVDYEKLSSARLLNNSEYTVNKALGYISLKTTLQTDQVLAVAYEFSYGGQTYQVGEFASDSTDISKALYVKTLKNTSNNPQQKNWQLMMKNVYYLASTVEKTKFRLDIKFQSDTAGVYLTYIPEVKDIPLLKGLGCDRLDNNNRLHPNGYFDFVEGYTVSEGRVFFPSAEPFGKTLRNFLKSNHVPEDKIKKYVFNELYDTTRTAARQMTDKNKYLLVGQFKGTAANVISLGAYNVPQGSVVVTAGGVVLTEGSDYSVDYSAGEVTILNQSIIDAGTNVSVSLESNTDYGMQRKTMLGLNFEYDFSKDLQLGGTIQHLTEQTLTSKVTMGSEPLRNTLWGLSLNWKHESQWLTNILDKLPFLHCTQPSQISFTGEFAQLIAGQAGGTQDNASYIDDFENAKNGIDVSEPRAWSISSVPSKNFSEYSDRDSVTSGFNRSLLSWYNIDPIFTYRSSSLTPSHIKSDLDQLSNHYVRAVYVSELYPNRQQSTYSGATATLPILDLAYYPEERGPYNLTTDISFDGKLSNPQNRWGGMMRKLDTNDFEAANVEYIEFWLLDPFIYTRQEGTASDYGGDLYINLGEVSEDVLRDGKKFAESGMPVDGTGNFSRSAWGKIPIQPITTYAFATSPGSRAKQDVGLNGLTDEEERAQPAYSNFLNGIHVNDSLRAAWNADPANDNYHYYRGADLDKRQASILERYKRINMPQGNSPDSEQQTEGFDTSYKTYPDVEDINQDFTLNEYERYFQYRVSIRPEDLRLGHNFITDIREASVALRNGNRETVKWYQFRIPLDQYEDLVGGISDLTSIRFMRMFLTQFKHPIVLRFGSLDLVRGEWRIYQQSLSNNTAESGTLEVSAVNIEENNDKRPVNYVLPPGITRATDPSQPQLVEENEQSMNLVVKNLAPNETKGVYKNTMLDLRRYKHMQMFVHANHLIDDVTNLKNGDLAVFVRVGSDYKNNYYEYEIPLSLTPDRNDYNKYNVEDCRAVWPQKNMLDVDLSVFTNLKKERNKSRSAGGASYNQLYSKSDPAHPENTISIMGNPSLGEVKTMIIGVRNISKEHKSGEVWVDELRLMEFNNKGGWAASGALNMQLSDVGTVNMTGKIVTNGFGGLEEGVLQRSLDDFKSYSITANVELGKFFPDKAQVSAPLYYSVSKEEKRPRYNPMDTDMELKDALDATANKHERDSIESIAVTKTTNTNFSLSNVRVGIKTKRHPMPYDPANFSFSYSHSHRYTSGETTVYEKEDRWQGSLHYNYTPVYKPWEPFKKMKSKSKWAQYPKQFGLNWLPQNIAFNTEILRNYYELQERDMEDLQGQKLPLTFNEQFLWNRDFSIRWDLTKNLHMNFQSATHAQIEEPYTPINKDLYPERYEAWKDSVWQSIRHFGVPLDYQQSFTASLQLPLNKLPIFDWVSSDATYTATYNWVRGTDLENGTNLGNTIANNRQLNINGNFNMETLYNHIPFLKKVNEKFKKAQTTPQGNNRRQRGKSKDNKDDNKNENKKGDNKSSQNKSQNKEEKILPKNQNAWQKEVTLAADSAIIVNHGKKSKKVNVVARTKDGKKYDIKYKVLDENRIRIKNLDTIQVMLSITPKKPSDNQWWYKPAQSAARVLMMLRSVSVSYRNQYAMSIPGFLPNIGDAFGQRTGSVMAPGLGFAFGLVDDSYLDKALNNGWLLVNESVATPATTNQTTDLQLKATLEPIRDLKIDLNASRTETKAKSIQYMYKGSPTTQSGTFTMTTISLKSAFEGIGDANNGFHSASFERFCNSLESYQRQAEARFGQDVNPYNASVMIPAFLSAYTSSGGGLSFFPALTRLLPNWTIRYTGLSRLPWFRDQFKSVTINHSYKSVYAVGSYTAKAGTTSLLGYNVPTVSVNESFAPLIGVDVTFHNNLTAKMEYRTTRVLNLSMTSIQINESRSNDWVIGLAYKINDFNIFGAGGNRKIKKAQRKNKQNAQDSKSKSDSAPKTGVNHDLNLRLDFSLRKQAAITRDIATQTSAASSGNTALKISFMADYTLSRLLTLSAYYDRQTNTPLLSSSSYPTTTHDFGLSLKFSLTR